MQNYLILAKYTIIIRKICFFLYVQVALAASAVMSFCVSIGVCVHCYIVACTNAMGAVLHSTRISGGVQSFCCLL